MPEEPANDQPVFVLTTSVVRWAIDELRAAKIHTFFPAYLELRRTAHLVGSGTGLHPNWSNLEQFLQVPGGPPGKPNFRPFWHTYRPEAQDWMNANIAGSYAPSSIRKVPLNVVTTEDSSYSLRENHATLALEHLLGGERAPAVALATFYYRNYGFTTDGRGLGPSELIATFREDFGFSPSADTDDFEILFSAAIPDRTDWFEPWPAESQTEGDA